MEPPSFSTAGPQTLRAAPGSDASLVVPLPSGSPPFEFEWTRAGAKLGDRFRSADDAGGVRLTVTAARTGDSGVYTLLASNAAGKDSTRVRLEVSPDEMPTGEDPPTFLRRLQDLTVKVGTRTRFLVEIVSSTECRVTWYRNERRLLEAERIALVRDGNFWCADISAVSVDDAGRWTCTAENVGGRASCSAHLNVLVPKAYKRPEFIEELRALLTEQGTVSLECKVVGVPTPVLRWFKDSREIKAGDVFALTANAEDPTSLGTYTCEAVNCMGRAYSSSKVHVVGRASREGSVRPSSGGITPEPPPIFTKDLEDHFVRICEPLTLSCHVVVPPWPRSVVWYNKEGKIEPSDRYHVLEDGVGGYLLEVPSAEWPDEGEWKCVATSSGGRVGISTCYVSMDVPKNYRKPRFMENLQAVLTEEGLVSFECKVVGFPTPVLSWFKDGQELKPGDVYQLTGTNSLGSYCCIARNCMGQASSSAELTVEDIQNQLNEEEKLQLFSRNQAPKFLQGLKSVEAKIDEPFRFTIKVAIPPEPTVLWYRDDQPVDESLRCHLGKEERGVFCLDIQNLEFMDQAEWKCVAMNDFGHSVTSCFLKLIIPRHYKKPRFLENLQAILSDEGAVNLECKVIGVPQPVLKWYKDGEELKPGDIHRIISGQDGTCCLGTYTCEAQNCMGIAASSASLLGFEDSMKAKSKKKADEQALQRNLSLSTIHEERTSQMYDTPVGDMTLDEKGEISFSFDGKEVSVSLYETPDLTEEEALQIVEMYADQLSENVTEHNVVELPPLRFVKETSTSGNLLMEAIIIDVSPEYFTSPEEDLRTEADIEDISIADENAPPQLSLDVEVEGEDYIEKTIALLSEEKSDFPKKIDRKKSDSQRSADDFFSLSRDQSLSEEKKDDDTQILSESDLQSFASARSSGKPKSKSSKPSIEDGPESSDITKTVLLKEDLQNQIVESDVTATKDIKQTQSSHSSRRSSLDGEKSLSKIKEGATEVKADTEIVKKKIDGSKQNILTNMNIISTSLTEVINEIQILERDIILKSEFMSTAATASNSLEIINSLITPLSEVHSIADAIREAYIESSENITPLMNQLPQSLGNLLRTLTLISKCVDVENDNKTLVKKTCMSIIKKCGKQLQDIIKVMNTTVSNECLSIEKVQMSNIETITKDLTNVISHSIEIVESEENRKTERDETVQVPTLESKHLSQTQKVIYDLKGSLKSLGLIVKEVDISKETGYDNIQMSEILLNDMSTPIQDLQTALEQIEILSLTESNSGLQKYNTQIIETAMESVLKLRTSFERLSTEARSMENKDALSEVLGEIKVNIKEISTHLDELETKTGSFDILNNDNKLEALQKMAQILINLENNLPNLETVPGIKEHMTEFHKNLTKALENVIESNDANKYFTLLEICDAVNRMNTSIKSIDTNSLLSLASINNALKNIQANLFENEFYPELNTLLLSNIANTFVCLQETINKAEELSLNENLEDVKYLSVLERDEQKVNILLENIEQTIVAISNITSHETAKDMLLRSTMVNICPILEDLKYSIASLNITATEQKNENFSTIESLSFTQSVANPLIELHQNINVLNQVACENTENQDLSQLLSEYAKPLLDLQHTLEVLQHDVLSQYVENESESNIRSSIANVIESLNSCIVMIREQPMVEATDDMSTLEDISGIKTTAEILPSDDFVTATVKEVQNVHFADKILPLPTSQTLQTLNEHINTLSNLDVLNIIDPAESCEYSSIKSSMIGLEEIRVQLESILPPITMDTCEEIPSLLNTSQLLEVIPTLRDIHQHLSVVDINNIPVYENISEKDHEKICLVKESMQKFKSYLNNCLDLVEPAIDATDNIIDISIKINSLRGSMENLNVSFTKFDTSIFSSKEINDDITKLENMVKTFLDSTYFENTAQIKYSIENLYEMVVLVQDELSQFCKDNPELLSNDNYLIQTIHEVEKEIVSLEQCDFINLSNSNILKKKIAKITTSDLHEELNNKEDILKSHLTELLTLLDTMSKHLLSDPIKEGNSNEKKIVELKSAELQLSYIIENMKSLDEYLNVKSMMSNDDISLGMKVNDKIDEILNSIKCSQFSESTQTIVQYIEKIKNILARTLSLEKVKEKQKSFKETAEALLQHMDHYIEIIEIVEEVSAEIKLEDLKESASIVRELQQSIVTIESVNEDNINDIPEGKINEEQTKIAQRLHKALVSLQTQALESAQEVTSTSDNNMQQQIMEVVTNLQNHLVALAGTNVLTEESEMVSNVDIIDEHQKDNAKVVLGEQHQLIETASCDLENTEVESVEVAEFNKLVTLSQVADSEKLNPPKLSSESNEEEKVYSGEDLSIPELKQSEPGDGSICIKPEKQTTLHDTLMQNVEDYISENTIRMIKSLTNPLHVEYLEKTIEIAKQLYHTKTETSTASENNAVGTLSAEQVELLISLNEALLIMYGTTIEENQQFQTKVGKKEFQTFKNVVSNLRNTIQEIIIGIQQLPALKENEECQQSESTTKEPVEHTPPSISQIISGSYKIENNEDQNTGNIDNKQIVELVESVETNHNLIKIEDISNETQTINAISLPVTNKDLSLVGLHSPVEENTREPDIKVDKEEPGLKNEIMKHLSNYFSKEIFDIIKKLAPLLEGENLNPSIELAQQLYGILSTEETETHIFSKEQLKLALLLDRSVLSLCKLTDQETERVKEIVSKNDLIKTNIGVKDLHNNLINLIEKTLIQHNLDVMDLDEFKVLILKDPFKYELLFIDNVVNTTTFKETTTEESTSVNQIDRKENDIETPEKNITQENFVNIFSAEIKENLDTGNITTDTNSIIKLENLLKEFNDMIDISNDDNFEAMQNTLDEVQTIIMELKSNFVGPVGDSINETLEDLECNVRSIQLQVNEQSSPVLLKEVCANIQSLVAHLSEINKVEEALQTSTNNNNSTSSSNMFDTCSQDVKQTIELIEKVVCSEKSHQLEHIIVKLNSIKDGIKYLKSNFLTDAETLIMNGIEIMQILDQTEEKLFCLEKDLDSEKNIGSLTRDNILSAVHCVYGSISNMRGTISSVQKKYMYENYGEPSRCFLVSIKNVMSLLKTDDKLPWKPFSKSLRKVLNHFEDIKFYINFDKTARLPSDAAFTKIILGELHSVLSGDVLKNVNDLNSDVINLVKDTTKYINKQLNNIEENTTLEVKDKIPIFKELSIRFFELTENIKLAFTQNEVKEECSNTVHEYEYQVAENTPKSDEDNNTVNIEYVKMISETIIKNDQKDIKDVTDADEIGCLIKDKIENQCLNDNKNLDAEQNKTPNIELKKNDNIQTKETIVEKVFDLKCDPTHKQLIILQKPQTAEKNVFDQADINQFDKENEEIEQNINIQENQNLPNMEIIQSKLTSSENVEQSNDNINEHYQKTSTESSGTSQEQSQAEHKENEIIEETKLLDKNAATNLIKEEEFSQLAKTKSLEEATRVKCLEQLNKDLEKNQAKLNITDTIEESTYSSGDNYEQKNIYVAIEIMTTDNNSKPEEEIVPEFDTRNYKNILEEEKQTLNTLQIVEDKNIIENVDLIDESIKEDIIKEIVMEAERDRDREVLFENRSEEMGCLASKELESCSKTESTKLSSETTSQVDQSFPESNNSQLQIQEDINNIYEIDQSKIEKEDVENKFKVEKIHADNYDDKVDLQKDTFVNESEKCKNVQEITEILVEKSTGHVLKPDDHNVQKVKDIENNNKSEIPINQNITHQNQKEEKEKDQGIRKNIDKPSTTHDETISTVDIMKIIDSDKDKIIDSDQTAFEEIKNVLTSKRQSDELESDTINNYIKNSFESAPSKLEHDEKTIIDKDIQKDNNININKTDTQNEEKETQEVKEKIKHSKSTSAEQKVKEMQDKIKVESINILRELCEETLSLIIPVVIEKNAEVKTEETLNSIIGDVLTIQPNVFQNKLQMVDLSESKQNVDDFKNDNNDKMLINKNGTDNAISMLVDSSNTEHSPINLEVIDKSGLDNSHIEEHSEINLKVVDQTELDPSKIEELSQVNLEVIDKTLMDSSKTEEHIQINLETVEKSMIDNYDTEEQSEINLEVIDNTRLDNSNIKEQNKINLETGNNTKTGSCDIEQQSKTNLEVINKTKSYGSNIEEHNQIKLETVDNTKSDSSNTEENSEITLEIIAKTSNTYNNNVEEQRQTNLEVIDKVTMDKSNTEKCSEINLEVSKEIVKSEITQDVKNGSDEVRSVVKDSHEVLSLSSTDMKVDEAVYSNSQRLKDENILSNEKEQKEHINKNEEIFNNETSATDVEKIQDNESQLTKSPEKPDQIISTEKHKHGDTTLNLKTENIDTLSLEGKLSGLKDLDKQIDNSVKESFKDNLCIKETHLQPDKQVILEKSDGICDELKEVKDMVDDTKSILESYDKINLVREQEEKQLGKVEEIKRSELINENLDKKSPENKHQAKDIIPEKPDEQMQEKYIDEEKYKEGKILKPEEPVQVETLSKEITETVEEKVSEKKYKEKRRSKKSRESSKQKATADEFEDKVQDTSNTGIEDNEKKATGKEDHSLRITCIEDTQNSIIVEENQLKKENAGQKLKPEIEFKENDDIIKDKQEIKELSVQEDERKAIENDKHKKATTTKKVIADEESTKELTGTKTEQVEKVESSNKKNENLQTPILPETAMQFDKNEKYEINNKSLLAQRMQERPENLEEENVKYGSSKVVDDNKISLKKEKMYDQKENNYSNKNMAITAYTVTDYESDFPRPPGYIGKTLDFDDTEYQIPINNKNQTIYKAQTLLHESQLRNSMPPQLDQSIDRSSGRLRIKERSKALSECRNSSSEKRTSSSRDVKRKPVFSTFLTDRTAVEGSRVKLTCSILSQTDPRIIWFKNGVELENKHKFRNKFVDGLITLEILNAVPSDSGEYSCNIENENGVVTSSAILKVYPSFEASPIPPTFTRSIRDTYHLAENELVLECRIRGQPLPTITWFKDDKPIELSERYQAHYLADGVCRLTINSPTTEDSGKYTCKAENSVWSDQINHEVYFIAGKSRSSPITTTIEKSHFSRLALESRRPHFTNVLSDHKVVTGGTIGLQVEIRGSPTRVEWLREGHSIKELYRNAQTYVDHGIYTLALSDVTEKESGLYTCRAYSTQGNVDMNASITVVQPNQYEGKPASIVSRPEKDVLISVGEDLNISFRVHGEPKPKVFFMKGIRDITNSQRVCKMTSDDYVKFTLKRSVVSDAGTYCIFTRNAYGCDRAFVTVVIRQRASSESLITDWTYTMDDLAMSIIERNYKSVPDRIPSEPTAVDGGNNWISLAWQKPDSQTKAPILAYKVESWLLGKEGGARWIELGITPRNSFDAFNLKQGDEYHFRVTPRNRYGWGESVQTSVPIGVGLDGDRPEFIDILPGQLKVLVGETANLSCTFKGKPVPEIVWMKNGHEIEEEVGRVSIEINDYHTSLRINEVKIEDEGRYSCEATNVHGRTSTYARVTVITDRQIWQADAKLKRERSAGVNGEYPPQFTMRLRDRRVQATYPVRLTCQVVGNPPPVLKWFKNDEEIILGGRHTASQDEFFYTLEIAPTTLEDGGVYQAMARNGCGAVSCRCSLVVDKGIRAYIAPEFCCGLEPLYRLSEGEELRISAIVEAYPSVGVTWYRDGVRLRPSRRAIMTLDRDGQIELALAAVTSRDTGVYTCTASNEVGMASTSGKVEVVSGEHVMEKASAPPIVISSDVPYSKEPMFIRKPRSSEAREGDTVIIECEVTGDPKPDVYWLRDFLKPDYYRDSSHFKRIGAGPAYRFEIPHAKLDYTGAYSIVAKNIHGEAKAIISLQILAKDPSCSDEVHNIKFGRVEVIPRFVKELTDLLCYDGDAVEFECYVSGNPDPDIRWFHYNEIIPDCSDFESSYDEGTMRLKIKQVTAEDEGTYTCEASNSLGKASTSACLVVYPPGEPNTLSTRLRRPPALLSAASTPRSTPRSTPARSLSRTPGPEPRRLCSPSREIAPKFYTYPFNRVAEEGDTVVFQCAVKGLPPPWATWDKDGIIITPSARISIREKDEMFRILEIEQVTIEDVGLYRISLENDYGRAEASARLEVITQKGKFYGSTRSYSMSPRKTLPYRRRTPSFSKQD